MTVRRLASAWIALLLTFSSSISIPISRADDPKKVENSKPKPGGSVAPSDPVFEALAIVDGKTTAGRLKTFTAEGAIVLTDDQGTDRSFRFDQLVRLTRIAEPPPFPPEGPLVLFKDGDRLQASIESSNDTLFEIKPAILGGQTLKVPLDSPSVMIVNPPATPEATDELIDRVRDDPRSGEVLYMGNGDRMTGGFLAINPRQVSFQPEKAKEKVGVERAGVVAIGFDSKLVEYKKPKGDDFVELTFTDGSRLGVSAPQLENGELSATTRFGAQIRLPLTKLFSLAFRSKKIDYLCERAEDAARYVGYIGPTRPYRRDRCVDGHHLRIGGRPYDHGIGSSSRTYLAYKLRPDDRRFQALIGLDDRAGQLGSAVFRVLLDGKERFVSPSLTTRDAPKTIDLDVQGAKVLILVTDFGDRGDVRDLADWVDARLIR